MNFAHLHLIINHIPVIGIPIVLVFLAFGLYTRNAPTQKFALLVLFALAAIALPIFLTGEPAEEVVEHLPGVSESFIESHEDAGKISLILTLLAGAAAFLALWFQKDDQKRTRINLIVMALAGVALISLLYTANLGGKVRHSELRGEAAIEGVIEPADTDSDEK